jgi:hypothetical protein
MARGLSVTKRSGDTSQLQMEYPLKTLLYELFVEPVLRLLTWPTMRRAKVAEVRTGPKAGRK